MDIHRCRFVPYPPSAINALAFSQTSDLTNSSRGGASLRLAIGRANGDIEIWNPLKGAWYQESILRGGKDRSIEGLVWIQDPDDVDKNGHRLAGKLRLFSIGYSTSVTEWDLSTGRPARHSAGSYGEVWCMAAQPKSSTSKKSLSSGEGLPTEELENQTQNIVVGCADGAIVLLNTSDGDLQFSRVLARPSKKKSRVLSIVFKNRHTVVAGHADSTIRIYDMRNSQQVRLMTLGSGPKGAPAETLVWTVKCLVDGTIVSGDSTGTLTFWDGKNYALLQRIKGHEADILELAVSADGNSVFSGGMDRRTTLYRRSNSGPQGERSSWAKITHQRMHSHDVKAMATFETKRMSILVSGGLDTIPIVVPIQEFGRESHRGLSHLPQEPVVRSAPSSRLIASWWGQEVSVWNIPKRQRDDMQEESPKIKGPQGRTLVAKIVLHGEESIASVDLSLDGSILTVSTLEQIKIFGLRPRAGCLRVQKLQAPPDLASKGAKIIRISPDKNWLAVVRADSSISLHRTNQDLKLKQFLQMPTKMVRLRRMSWEVTTGKSKPESLGSFTKCINQLAFSSDSRILAVADISGHIDTWVLEGHEDLTQGGNQDLNSKQNSLSAGSDSDSDSDEEAHPTVIFGQHWIRNPSASLLIKLPAAPLVFTFRPSSTSSSSTLTNGNILPHPTRHTPHPHSHDLLNGEDRLFVVTARNQMYEFNVLTGRISDWSRRNPTSSLPREFRDVRDRAMGAVWDVRGQNQRIWIHGVSWLWMFDLSQDMPAVEQTNEEVPSIKGNGAVTSTKRKGGADRLEDPPTKRPKYDTGAGSKIKDSELNLGFNTKIRRLKGAEGDVQIIDLASEQRNILATGHEEESEESDSTSENELLKLRRTNGHVKTEEEDVEDGTEGESISNDENALVKRAPRKRQAYWHTYKYRPILGIVPLGGGTDEEEVDGDEDEDSVPGLEVALVERPIWDLDLPAQYYGDQEWKS